MHLFSLLRPASLSVLSLCYPCSSCLCAGMAWQGLQAVSVLDLYSEEQVGPTYIPSEVYPSDHLAIASDLQLLW